MPLPGIRPPSTPVTSPGDTNVSTPTTAPSPPAGTPRRRASTGGALANLPALAQARRASDTVPPAPNQSNGARMKEMQSIQDGQAAIQNGQLEIQSMQNMIATAKERLDLEKLASHNMTELTKN